MSRALPQDVVDFIRRDHEDGIPHRRTCARVLIVYNRKIDSARIRAVLGLAVETDPKPAGMRSYLSLELVDPADYADRQGLRNIWGLLHKPKGDPWHVLRTPFEVSGEHCYRVMPPDAIPFTVWGPGTPEGFARAMMPRGITVGYLPTIFDRRAA